MTSNHTLILLGATGETGKQALLAALSSPSISHIHSFGRTPPTIPPPTAVSNPDQSKLTHHHLDFELLCDQGPQGEEGRKLKDVGADAVVIALGTTAKLAGSGDRFERIDREYVLKAAEAARVPDKDQKVVYVSAQFASSSARFLYPKSKGLTEEGLASLGYTDTVIARPGYLACVRKEGRLLETMFGTVTNALSLFTPRLQIPTPVLGRALIRAAIAPASELHTPEFGREEDLGGKGLKAWVVGNEQALKLGEGSARM